MRYLYYLNTDETNNVGNHSALLEFSVIRQNPWKMLVKEFMFLAKFQTSACYFTQIAIIRRLKLYKSSLFHIFET